MNVPGCHTEVPVEAMLSTPTVVSPVCSDMNVFLPADFDPSNYDVICGLGKMFDDHMGNSWFRFSILMNLEAYTNSDSKFAKTLVVNSIIDQVRSLSPNGGFVKRDSLSGQWFALGDISAQQEVIHAFDDTIAASRAPFNFNQTVASSAGLDYNHSETSFPLGQIEEEPAFLLGDKLQPEAYLTNNNVVNSINEQAKGSSPKDGFVKRRDSLIGKWFDIDDQSGQQKVIHTFHDSVAASRAPVKLKLTTTPETSLNYDHSETSFQQCRMKEPTTVPLVEAFQQEDCLMMNNKVVRGYSNTITVLPVDFKPSNYDIICGRGKLRHEHIGNRRYQMTIEMNVAKYMKAACRVDKSVVVDNIFDQIKATGPGFVKIDHQTGRWVALGDESSREKIGHSIRDAVQRVSPSVTSKRTDKKRTKAGSPRTLASRTA